MLSAKELRSNFDLKEEEQKNEILKSFIKEFETEIQKILYQNEDFPKNKLKDKYINCKYRITYCPKNIDVKDFAEHLKSKGYVVSYGTYGHGDNCAFSFSVYF